MPASSPTKVLKRLSDYIDGYTQPGASPNSALQGTNAVLKIELDGTDTPASNGLVIRASGSGSVTKGLVINRFSFEGVVTDVGSSQNSIKGNFIGTDPSGTLDLGNEGDRVGIFGSTSSTVGGSSPDKRNLISGNHQQGVKIRGVTTVTASSNRVEGNLIGTKKDATTALGNSGNGVAIAVAAPNNLVFGNTIAFNGADGVDIVEMPNSNDTNGNLLLGDSIFSNGQEGIDLGGDGPTANDGDNSATMQPDPDADTGANELQNFPVLTSAKTTRKGTTITGTLNSTPNKTFTLQFFSNASGGDEGQKFIGQIGLTTDGSGNASFTFKLAQKVGRGQKITATATDTSAQNTSEFSAAKKVVRKR